MPIQISGEMPFGMIMSCPPNTCSEVFAIQTREQESVITPKEIALRIGTDANVVKHSFFRDHLANSIKPFILSF